MFKRIISSVLSLTILVSFSCTGTYSARPSPLMWGPIKIAKSLNGGKVTKGFERPKFKKGIDSTVNNLKFESRRSSDFEPLAPEEKRSAVVVAVVLILLIAASIAVPIITLTVM